MGLWIGLKTLPREPILGLKRLLLPVSYWRNAEFAYVLGRLASYPHGSRVLDLGSPKDLALMLARHRRHDVVAVDILPQAVALSRRYAQAQGLEGEGPGKVRSEVQDGRALPYRDHAFDAAYSVSVLEHIPEQGDTAAIRELVRVVKPGGDVVVTVPYARDYFETFVNHSVYERRQVAAEPVFFERHYDESALRERLINPVSAELAGLHLWGESALRVESMLNRLGALRDLVSPFEPLLSIACLREVTRAKGGHPMAAFLTFKRL